VAIGFGAGRAPAAPGTVGTLVAVPLYFVLSFLPVAIYALLVAAFFLFGVWVCRIAEAELGQRDHPAIVWDEIVGFLITMFLAPQGPHTWRWLLIGFLLFRAFDIWKPPPIRSLERWEGGLGVMADDAMAGVYACIVLQVIVWVGAYR
jgi:phosphatidylglycerophosphatase A